MVKYKVMYGKGMGRKPYKMGTKVRFFGTRKAALRVSRKIAGRRFHNPRVARG